MKKSLLLNLIVLIFLFASSILFGIDLNFSNTYLRDILNEITNQSKINIVYPSSIEPLKVSINLSKADLDTALKLLLLPLNLDFEKVSEDIYVIYSLENVSKDRYIGEYIIKHTNPKYLTNLIESMGYDAYSYNGKIYFYAPTKNSYERITKILENMDLPRQGDVLFLSVKYYSKSEISSTKEFSKEGTGIADFVNIFEKLKSRKEIFTFVNFDELSQESKKILSFDDLMEIENSQNDSSTLLVIRTKESTINIPVSELLASENNGKVINYVIRVGDDILLTTFQIFKNSDDFSDKNSLNLTMLSQQMKKKASQKIDKTLFNVTSNKLLTTLQTGTERLNSSVTFKNSDFTLTTIELCVSLLDNVYAYLDYVIDEKDVGVSLSDIISTNSLYLYSKFRYSISKNEFSLLTQTGLKLKIQNLELTPSLLVDSKDGLFYGIVTGLNLENFFGEIRIFLNTQLQIIWGLKLLW